MLYPSREIWLVAVVLLFLIVRIESDSCASSCEQIEPPTTLALLQLAKHREPTLADSTAASHQPAIASISTGELSVLSVSSGINYTAAALELAAANQRPSAAAPAVTAAWQPALQAAVAIAASQKPVVQQLAVPQLGPAAQVAGVGAGAAPPQPTAQQPAVAELATATQAADAALRQQAAPPPVNPERGPVLPASAALKLANVQPMEPPVPPPVAFPQANAALLQPAGQPPVAQLVHPVPEGYIYAAWQQSAGPPPVQPAPPAAPQPLTGAVTEHPAAPPQDASIFHEATAAQVPDNDISPGGFEGLVAHAGQALALAEAGEISSRSRLERQLSAQPVDEIAQLKAQNKQGGADTANGVVAKKDTGAGDAQLGLLEKVQNQVANMSVFDISCYVGAGVIMFLFLVLADII